jgi:hypothetical protein
LFPKYRLTHLFPTNHQYLKYRLFLKIHLHPELQLPLELLPVLPHLVLPEPQHPKLLVLPEIQLPLELLPVLPHLVLPEPQHPKLLVLPEPQLLPELLEHLKEKFLQLSNRQHLVV